MSTIISLIILGISLSMDTFSISLSLGTFKITNKKIIIFNVFVGLFHFFLPLIGTILGNKIINFLQIKVNVLLGIILLFICIDIVIELIKNDKEIILLNILNIIMLSITVSLDSFSTGLGLKAITNNYLIASFIFSFCAIIFTIMGFILGKYSSNKLGNYANILGILLLLIMGIYHLFC